MRHCLLQTGDIVYVWPGTYALTAPLVPAAAYSIVGAAKRRVIFQHTATANTTLLTMYPGFSMREVELHLLSAGHHTLTGVLFDDATVQTAYLRAVRLVVDNAGAGAGASQVSGMLIQSTGGLSITTPLFESQIEVRTTGTGRKRGIRLDTSNCEVNLNAVDVYLSAPASVDAINVEINKAGAVLRHLSGVVDLIAAASPTTNANVSQTAGDLLVSAAVHLRQGSCKGLSFGTPGQAGDMAFGDIGPIAAGPLYLRRGQSAAAAVEADAQCAFAGPRIIQKLVVHAGAAPGGANTCTVTVRKNGVDTPLTVTLTGAQVLNSNMTAAVEFSATDLMSISASDTGATQDLNVTVQETAWAA